MSIGISLGMGLGRSNKRTAATFVSDTFTAADGTNVTARAGEIGATWTLHPSYAAATLITSNRARGGAANGAVYASGTPPSADYSVSCDLVPITILGGSGICGRVDTAANTFYYTRYFAATTAWELYKFVGGTATQLGSGSIATLTLGQTYRLTLDMVGTTIRLLVGGTQLISVTDSAITAAGRVGMRFSPTAGATDGFHLDNLVAIG